MKLRDFIEQLVDHADLDSEIQIKSLNHDHEVATKQEIISMKIETKISDLGADGNLMTRKVWGDLLLQSGGQLKSASPIFSSKNSSVQDSMSFGTLIKAMKAAGISEQATGAYKLPPDFVGKTDKKIQHNTPKKEK